ncbi:MAG: amidohydrolase [Gemmatimonadales bacterium]|nr:MAG: amidohydrolase [Gemmatimonadales bacterium]
MARTRRSLCFWPAGPILLAALLASCNPGKGKTAYVGGTLWDGTGAPPILDAVIVVDGDRVERAGPPDQVSVPRGATEVRLDGKWVIPGLIDAHVHAARWTLARYLAYGITSARDMGGIQDSIVALRDEVSLRSIAGPNLYISGAMIEAAPTQHPMAVGVGSPETARRAIDQLALLDGSQAKVYARIDSALLAAIMDEAKVLNLPVAGHLGKVDALTAARMGLRSLEHLTGVVESALPNPQLFFQAHEDFWTGWNTVARAWAGADSATLDRVARELARTGVAIVPTLVLHEGYAQLGNEGYFAGLDFSGVPDSIRRAATPASVRQRARVLPSDLAAFRLGRRMQDLFVRAFKRAGGLVAAGSDSPNPLVPPGAGLHYELELLVRAGLTPREALLAATRDAARLLGADTIGVVRSGALADFVVLSASPLEDVANTRRIEMVVSRGLARSAAELRALWR